MTVFTIGSLYTRDDVANVIGMPRERRGGSWATGYDEWANEVFIFANIGTPGRTGHDYANRWEGDQLVWYGKSRAHRGQPQIERIISNAATAHVFWRSTDRAPFTYAGIGKAKHATEDTPVQVRWAFS